MGDEEKAGRLDQDPKLGLVCSRSKYDDLNVESRG